ncbi:ankyrin, partial [Choiromyces venosus 120613-1]
LHPDTKDSKNRTPLGLAAKHGRVDYVKILAAREDVDVDWENHRSMTPLLLAVLNGREEVVRILTLLHFGLDPDMKDSKSRTPLGLAAKHGRVDFVKILAARGDVDVGWENYKFMTPLLLA